MRGLNGNEAAQPRVFAHNMIPIALGAINPSTIGGPYGVGAYAENGLEMTSGGTGHAVGDILTLGTSTGAPTEAAKIEVLTISGTAATGPITSFKLSFTGTLNKPFGEGYAVADTADQSATTGAGVGFTSEVVNIDLPFTAERGVCIYVSRAVDGADGMDVILESGQLYNTDSTTRMKGATAGSFLPILAKKIVAVGTYADGTGYAAGDLVAMY